MIYHVQVSTVMSMNFNTELVTIFYPCTVCWQGTGIEITSVKDKKHTHTHSETEQNIHSLFLSFKVVSYLIFNCPIDNLAMSVTFHPFE